MGPVDDKQRRPHSGYRGSEGGEQLLADAVNPLSVLNDVNRRCRARQRNTFDEVDKTTTSGVRIDVRTRAGADAEQVIEQEQILRAGLGDLAADPRPSLLSCDTDNAENRAQQPGDHMQRDVASVGFAVSDEYLETTTSRSCYRLADQPGLSDTWPTSHRDNGSFAATGPVQ